MNQEWINPEVVEIPGIPFKAVIWERDPSTPSFSTFKYCVDYSSPKIKIPKRKYYRDLSQLQRNIIAFLEFNQSRENKKKEKRDAGKEASEKFKSKAKIKGIE